MSKAMGWLIVALIIVNIILSATPRTSSKTSLPVSPVKPNFQKALEPKPIGKEVAQVRRAETRQETSMIKATDTNGIVIKMSPEETDRLGVPVIEPETLLDGTLNPKYRGTRDSIPHWTEPSIRPETKDGIVI